jgi:hypothetical protein
MGTRYNPGSLTTNCGFCAIAHGLYLQGTVTDADTLYLQTLARLGLTRNGNIDPIPRQLIFPDPLLDGIPLSAEYRALADRGHGPSSYTITAVASASNLRYQLNNKDLSLQRQFFEFYAHAALDRWNIGDFVQMRLNWLASQGRNPSPEAVRKYVFDQLGGHSIMGSKTVNHFINVEVDGSGHITAFDAQDGRRYNGLGLHTRLRTVDLFMPLR